ncbi:MAG: hypothetical protein IJ709_01275, partial [Selenomonas sp.]|nr:hypothetical protein [Selenomonas sp.]
VESNYEKLLGKNGELVEERKKQILKGAIKIISEHYKDKPKMEAIAAIFGKKMGEEFAVSVPLYNEYHELKNKVIVKGWFDSRGFKSEQIMIADSYIFAELVAEEAEIVNE